MRNFFWISLAASTCLLANEHVELFGTGIEANGTVAKASQSPVASYQDQILSADEITFDRNTSIIEAKGKVNIFKANQYRIMSDYTRVNLVDDTRYSKPYYMIDDSSQAWISSAEAEACKNEIDLKSGTVSGCDSADPLWKIRFTSADYDSDEMWVNLYNARLEVENISLFYLPYFGYPTDRTRRSGLLMPTLGLSNSEGFYYQQPIYFAPQNWWDLELRPQIRTSRGSGLYGDFRFIDTASSEGLISVGYFKEKSDYALEYDLANQKHYGYKIHYRHTNPLREWFGSTLEGESGVYVDGLWMNDVDYLNLQHSDETQNITDNQILSRINLYYNSEDNYFGTYLKHYQYLDQNTNAQTIQTLPTFHYHRYLETLLDNHLLLSVDAMATHFYRPDGKRANQFDVNLPLTFQTPLFDEYLDISYTANLNSKAISFYGNTKNSYLDKNNNLIVDNGQYEQGFYAQLDHTLALSSTLVRPYENYVHVVNPFIAYTESGKRFYSGYYDTYHESDVCIPGNTVAACEYYNLNEPSDTLSLGLSNFLVQDGKQILVDRLSQNFVYGEGKSYYGELQNELEWEISEAISFYNQTSFNHDRDRITKEQNSLRYNDGIVAAGISHYYTDELRNNAAVYSSYWTADAAYQYNRHYKIFGLVAYDYREDLMKRSEVGFLYSRRCLDFGIRYVQNRRPILTNTSGDDSVNDSYIFITIILKPIGGSEFNYRLDN